MMKKLLLLLLIGCSLPLAFGQNTIQKNTQINIIARGLPPGEQSRIDAPYQVDEQGNINLWEIGTIRAAGLSPNALGRKIEEAYKQAEIYTSPSIQVQTNNVEGELQQLVTVSGSVVRQGTVPYIRDMTLAQAIAAAGGPSTFGTTKRVHVYREGKKYLLSPLTNDAHKLERIFPQDTIEVDQVKPWESGGK